MQEITARKVRNDGKPARSPRLGTPKSSLVPPSTFQEGEEPAPWHDLVLPGPKGNPERTYQRREDRGQVVALNPVPVVRELQRPGGYRQPSWLQRPSWRLRARGSGGIDRTKGTAAAVESKQLNDARRVARRVARLARAA